MKYAYKPNRQLAEHGWRKRLLLVLIPIFLLSSVLYGIYIYKSHKDDFAKLNISAWATKVKTVMSHKPIKQNTTVINSPIKAENKQDNEIQFDFYTELPNMQLTVAEPANSAAIGTTDVTRNISFKKAEQPKENEEITTISSSKKEQYVLQIAAFKNQTAAGEMRVSLLLAGHEVNMVKSKSGDQLIYLLQQGPYSSMPQAKSVQQELKKKGIDSVVKKVD